ncbi:MAG: SDR family oxidoreductase [Flavobacteriales bacterium]|nr:SDR family oxidoreductase [Flavobacteriales bacterium]
MQNFKNKVAWVVGASSGIGKEMAIQLAKHGAKVILSSRKQDELELVKSELNDTSIHMILPLDLEHSENFKEITEQVIQKFGRIDFLFNNGGLSQRSNAAETPLEVDRRIMEINYFGNIALAKAVLPFMQKQQSGHFVIISSIAGKFGFFLRSAYSASKHALHGFYDSVLLEEEKNGINVTIACPGKINTNISVNALNSTGEKHGEMDHNQETGMSAEECVQELLVAVSKNKKEVLIGNKEIKAVTLKRLFPRLFWKVIRKQKAT